MELSINIKFGGDALGILIESFTKLFGKAAARAEDSNCTIDCEGASYLPEILLALFIVTLLIYIIYKIKTNEPKKKSRRKRK